jgi:hypothetical protein
MDKYDILNVINDLPLNDIKLINIFKIIHKNNCLYSKLNNGIFVDINTIPYNILEEIDNILFNNIEL